MHPLPTLRSGDSASAGGSAALRRSWPRRAPGLVLWLTFWGFRFAGGGEVGAALPRAVRKTAGALRTVGRRLPLKTEAEAAGNCVRVVLVPAQLALVTDIG
jgi:hypothetical protein